jgi:16S rRNA (guanine527-N7)-methyltransferase
MDVSPGQPLDSGSPSTPGSAAESLVPPPPAAARELFGPAIDAVIRYAGMLAGPGVERGLIGPSEAPRLWDRHLMNSAAVAGLLPPESPGEPSTVIDLGSGAGLPGIVLALLRPDLRFVLLESMARRVTFLTECVAELDLANVTVHRDRAEDVAGILTADVVVARAVAPLGRLAELALGLTRPGGLVLAIKGSSAADEIARSRPDLRRLGVRDVEIIRAGAAPDGETGAGQTAGEGSAVATVVRFTAPPAAARRDSRSRPSKGRSSRAGPATTQSPAAQSPAAQSSGGQRGNYRARRGGR